MHEASACTRSALSFAALAAAVLALSAAGPVQAATPAYLTQDHSNAQLIDKAALQAVWKAQLPDATARRLARLKPAAKWGFLTQVEGGFTADKTCVVTARVMLLPRSGKSLLMKPDETATSFDAKAGATMEQCKALAQDKLGEAVAAVLSSQVAAK